MTKGLSGECTSLATQEYANGQAYPVDTDETLLSDWLKKTAALFRGGPICDSSNGRGLGPAYDQLGAGANVGEPTTTATVRVTNNQGRGEGL